MMDGLLLFHQRGEKFIHIRKLVFRKRNTRSAVDQILPIAVVGGDSTIEIFGQYTYILLIASVADIRRLGKLRTMFFLEVGT
jgi:hypothetical protein